MSFFFHPYLERVGGTELDPIGRRIHPELQEQHSPASICSTAGGCPVNSRSRLPLTREWTLSALRYRPAKRRLLCVCLMSLLSLGCEPRASPVTHQVARRCSWGLCSADSRAASDPDALPDPQVIYNDKRHQVVSPERGRVRMERMQWPICEWDSPSRTARDGAGSGSPTAH
jgi:hypothetical protein